jgi:hypothetical protein
MPSDHDTPDSKADTTVWGRPSPAAITIIGFLVVAAVVFVASSLRRPTPLTFYPISDIDPQEVGDRLVGPSVHTVDGRVDGFTYFDFSRGSVVESPSRLGWDLAFQRFNILANGGPDFAGQGGILDLGAGSLDSLTVVPTSGYAANTAGREVSNAATADWYEYSWTSHVLSPKPKLFAVRTADGRYAVFEILSYYCPTAQAGCTTIRYRYQGAGGTAFDPAEAREDVGGDGDV